MVFKGLWHTLLIEYIKTMRLYYVHLHFTSEKTSSGKLSDLTTMTQSVNGKSWI